MSFPLRDYQDALVNKVRQAIREGNRRILVVAATGSGKTVVFSYMAKSAAAKGKRILILAHRDALIRQASEKLYAYGVNHGVIMAGWTPTPLHNVQVASVQTLVRRLGKMQQHFDIIVVDEAHLSAAKSYLKILEHFSRAYVLGFTGSPCRLDNKPLGREVGGVYDHLVEAISVRQLIDEGFLVRPRYFASQQHLDLSGIKKQSGDYSQKELAERVDVPRLVGDAVTQYKRICPGVPAVAWCVNLAHAEHVCDAFNEAGVASVMLSGSDSGEKREKVMKQLTNGSVKVVTFVGILVEGVDCPAIGAIIMLRPTLSLASYLQVIGRGLRPHPGKECCYVLDHAGLTFKHGLVQEDREWSLLEGVVKNTVKKDEEKVSLIMCKACFAVFSPPEPPDPMRCPHCGAPVEKPKQASLEAAEGDLQEITDDMASQIKREKKREVAQAKTLEDLQKIGAQRGYKPGWADAVYEARKRKTG